MRMLFAKLSVLVVSTLFSASLQAQETVISVGTPESSVSGNLFIQRIASDNLSTAQIDGVLRNVAPSTFGQNFTRDKANKVFTDFFNLKVSLASTLTQMLPIVEPKIRQIYSLTINTNALNLRLSQKTNAVSADLGSITAFTSLKYDAGIPVACPSANVSFTINNIKVSGDYNFITGDVSNANANYTIDNISTSCNGLFGFLGNIANAVTGLGNSAVRSAIQDAFNSGIAFVNMKQLFSLADFANGLHRFRTETPITAIANRAIGVFQEIVNDAAINTPGIVLDVGVQFASTAGEPNRIKFVASHAPIDIIDITAVYGRTNIRLNRPPNTGPVDVYRNFGGQSFYLGTTTSGVLRYPGQIIQGAEIAAVGRNTIIPGLESLPGFSGSAPDPNAPPQ